MRFIDSTMDLKKKKMKENEFTKDMQKNNNYQRVPHYQDFFDCKVYKP
jgi:hypothetical protein